MKNKIIGIFVCTLLLTTCVIPICGNLTESQIQKSSVSPGDYFKVMFFGDRFRSYRYHVPPSYDGLTPTPLVIVFHGFPDNAHDIQSIGMNAEADKEGFIVVYPNGHTYWRDFVQIYLGIMNLIYFHRWGYVFNCWDFDPIDDVGFIRTLIETLQTTMVIDSSRIYITGLSGGAFTTYRLGAELSDVVAAIAPVAGSIGGIWHTESPPCYIIPRPEHPLPIIIFNAMNDSAVPYDGGWVNNSILLNIPVNFYYLSVNESVSFWVEHNQCDPNPQIEISESGNIIKKTYANGSDDSEVVFYTVVDGVHGWFGAPDWPYEYPCEISATELIWEFFEAHPKQ